MLRLLTDCNPRCSSGFFRVEGREILCLSIVLPTGDKESPVQSWTNQLLYSTQQVKDKESKSTLSSIPKESFPPTEVRRAALEAGKSLSCPSIPSYPSDMTLTLSTVLQVG